MLLEDILLFLLIGSGVFLIGIPFFKLIRAVVPNKRNPVQEAKERLEQARLELEAAKVNKEVEKVYENLYSDVTEDETENRRKL